MEAPVLIGLGVGFAAVGLIFSTLLARKPDLPMFQKYTEKQFGRTQGMTVVCIIFGLLLAIEGAMLQLGMLEGENPAATLMGWGAGIMVIGLVFGLLSIYKPNLAMFQRYTGKKLYQAQGTLMTAGAFGLLFLLLGLMGKPWAV